jgi:8-oxo-dGTP pyrophosphatase MutT (NUDIX family)
MPIVSTTLSFDPRQVPVARIDHDLPAVPLAQLQPDALKARFARPPLWRPEIQSEPQFTQRPPAHAAVLIPIIMRGPQASEPTVLLTQRTAHLSTHSGQIAFPGGKVDPEDTDRQRTALREAQEEVGLDPRHVQVLGELPVYITGTSFLITPVIGLVSSDLVITPNANEVADVFEVPLVFLMNPAHHRLHAFDWQGAQRQWFSMPYLESRVAPDGQVALVERFIWGATAAMLRNFYRFLVINAEG